MTQPEPTVVMESSDSYTDEEGGVWTTSFTTTYQPAPPPPPEPTISDHWWEPNFGVDFPPNEIDQHLATWGPNMQYHRIFDTNWPSTGPTSKIVRLPANCIRHISAKNISAGSFTTYLDTLWAMIQNGQLPWNVTFDFSVHHEPYDDIVDDGRITLAKYKADNQLMVETIRNHPITAHVRAVCPILTMDQVRGGGTIPRGEFFLLNLHNAVAADPYNRQLEIYRPMSMMIDPLVSWASDLGVPAIFAEVGGEPINGDSSATGQAAWFTEMTERVKQFWSVAHENQTLSGRPIGFGLWCVGGMHIHSGPTLTAYKNVLDTQAAWVTQQG